MELRVFTEPQQGASYETLLTVAREAEALGFDAFFRSDHLLSIGGDGLPGPTDAWVTLAGLARDTSTIRLGTLVTPVTFRQPGVLAITVAQVDQMSGGRVELGLGTGWYDDEHTAYGVPFPPTPVRFEMLEEQLEILTGLWSAPVGDTFSFSGLHYSLVGSPALPKPEQVPPPIVMGGFGPTKTPRLAARFASEFNTPFASVVDFAAQRDRVLAACDEHGRDPASLAFSAAVTVCCGADDAEVGRRAAAIGHDVDALSLNGVVGTPDQVTERLTEYCDAGASRAYLQVLDLDDLDHLRLIAAEVLPAVAAI